MEIEKPPKKQLLPSNEENDTETLSYPLTMAFKHQAGPACKSCNQKLTEAHPALEIWFLAKKKKYVNLHIAWSFRNEAEQNACFRDLKTKLIWPHSKHNVMFGNKPESHALDLFLIDEDGQGRWPYIFFKKLADECKSDRDEITWGGDFNNKGNDFDHFEMKEPT